MKNNLKEKKKKMLKKMLSEQMNKKSMDGKGGCGGKKKY